MQHLLLTGAGFTRNWNGWLAKELEGDVLARLAKHPVVREHVQKSDNYEDALQTARGVAFSRPGLGPGAVSILEGAIKEAFWAMNTALARRISMELSSKEGAPSIQEFIGRFDAIFTLNQDLMLEFHYKPAAVQQHRWSGTYYPGIEPSVMPTLHEAELIHLRRQVASVGPPMPSLQPIYKMHGSIDWIDGSGSLFVVGGGKEEYIRSKPLLRTYFDEFDARLRSPDTRLMIVGYGFADDHVNKLIVEAAAANATLSIYYVHPESREAVHRGKQHRLMIGYAPPPIFAVPCIGESRRPLATTFGEDHLEYEKLMRFFL